MPPPSDKKDYLSYEGLDVWLQDAYGDPITHSEEIAIDTDSRKISSIVYIDEKTSYTLRWRVSDNRPKLSAVCHVFVKDGHHKTTPDEVCVANVVMDKKKSSTQKRRTNGWLNPPYSRTGALRIRSRNSVDYTTSQGSRDSYCFGHVRLVIQQVRGCVVEPKWLAGPDEDREKCVLNLEDMDMVEDDAMEFQFTFRDCRELVHLQKAKVGKSSPNGVGKSSESDSEARREEQTSMASSSLTNTSTGVPKSHSKKRELEDHDALPESSSHASSSSPVVPDLKRIKRQSVEVELSSIHVNHESGNFVALKAEYDTLDAESKDLQRKLRDKIKIMKAQNEQTRRLLET